MESRVKELVVRFTNVCAERISMDIMEDNGLGANQNTICVPNTPFFSTVVPDLILVSPCLERRLTVDTN
jgi:hypothetical protein